jgi:hypothetical protein
VEFRVQKFHSCTDIPESILAEGNVKKRKNTLLNNKKVL